MTPLVAAVGKRLLVKFGKWWLAVRPLSKKARQDRQDRRELNRELKAAGLSRKERKMELLKAFLANRRTSTKAGAAGFVPLIAMLPFYDTINDYLVQACQSEEGPTVFLVGGAVVWVTMFVAARASKSPTNPGVL